MRCGPWIDLCEIWKVATLIETLNSDEEALVVNGLALLEQESAHVEGVANVIEIQMVNENENQNGGVYVEVMVNENRSGGGL
jgi:hypothetical protein